MAAEASGETPRGGPDGHIPLDRMTPQQLAAANAQQGARVGAGSLFHPKGSPDSFPE
jgi:hypothetical protein